MGSHDVADDVQSRDVVIAMENVALQGTLEVPANAVGAVLFAHGSGSSRFSPRNQLVAERLKAYGLASLLIDLLTETEERVDRVTAALRFDISFLAERLLNVAHWLAREPLTQALPLGIFGASTGGGAAIVAAARDQGRIGAIVSRGGRPDMAGAELRQATCPTLLIVGGNDQVVIELNRRAMEELGGSVKELVIVPGASHLFEEAGALEQVAQLAGEWFRQYLSATASAHEGDSS